MRERVRREEGTREREREGARGGQTLFCRLQRERGYMAEKSTGRGGFSLVPMGVSFCGRDEGGKKRGEREGERPRTRDGIKAKEEATTTAPVPPPQSPLFATHKPHTPRTHTHTYPNTTHTQLKKKHRSATHTHPAETPRFVQKKARCVVGLSSQGSQNYNTYTLP